MKKKIYKIFASKKLHQQIINGGRKKKRERYREKQRRKWGFIIYLVRTYASKNLKLKKMKKS